MAWGGFLFLACWILTSLAPLPAVERLFGAMSDCQALHPDPTMLLEDDDELFTGEGEFDDLSPEGQATLARLEGLFLSGEQEAEPDRFEDVEDDQ